MIKVNLLEQARREPASKAGPSISFEGMGNLPNIATIVLIVATLGWAVYTYYDLSRTKEDLDIQIADTTLVFIEYKTANVITMIDLVFRPGIGGNQTTGNHCE